MLTTAPPRSPADALAAQQQRVAELLTAAPAAALRSRRLPDAEHVRLVGSGHFPAYAAELAWTPHEVAGHLRDSARVFTARVARLRTEDDPLLPDFDPTAADRVAGYAAVPTSRLLDELREAQAGLLAAVRGVPDAERARTGRHATDGALTLGDVLDFLPGHQRDHAEQLAALLR
ncbi:DinB family protein [Blastococcus sp. BMG 814]|uniref:DinB family protein n=1 Tax=Blastococcus carthaginiensis TaxID=3050034 RepID=A0ABT9I6C7_9ACTN|nr:DinB family protein [Blastococcus carthaginiensis]MDP5181093.1 DinB family protein [Blastococcus carthaginiensis]